MTPRSWAVARSNLLRQASLAASLLLFVFFLAGCGDTFRPVATPITQPGGDPNLSRRAVVLENNGGTPAATGGVDVFDVSGDTNVGFVSSGHDPVFLASSPGGGRIWVSNQPDDSLSTFATLAPSNGAITVSLPPGSRPGFMATVQSDNMFVAETGTNKVGAVSQSQLILAAEIAVPASPKFLVELPDAAKLYSINTDGSISDITPSDFSSPAKTFPSGGTDPTWALASPDSGSLFVLDGASNTIFVVNTGTDAVTAVAAPGLSNPVFAVFDPRFNRLYVANRGGNSVSILDGSQPTTLPSLTSSPVPVGSAPVALTVLADGSRAYVANSASGTVSVINGSSLTLSKTIPVGTNPLSIASSSDSKRVYVANRDTPPSTSPTGSISIITTSTDSVVVSARPTTSGPIQTIMAQ